VRFHEARQQRAALGVNPARFRSCQSLDLGVGADGGDPVAAALGSMVSTLAFVNTKVGVMRSLLSGAGA
jgi:hypothetical protein